ncbi:hypothetical protein AALB39_13030 [Lachnospiraceae bacterium 54-53]
MKLQFLKRRMGITDDSQSSAFLDWLCSFSAFGDDGRQYWFGCSPLILKLEKIDMFFYEFTTEPGEVIQDPRSIYKIAKFPGVHLSNKQIFPTNTHQVRQFDDKVVVDIGCCRIECFKDHSWHYTINDEEKNFKADFYHRPAGGPLWYGKEQPSFLTQHSITYGYNWSGNVEGTFRFEGKEVHFKGAGIRERYVAVDSSAAEIGGWEDWGWFHFDEASGSLYEMKLGRKDLAVYLTEEQTYIPAGELTIRHHEWAYLPQFGGFIPTLYKIEIKTPEGVLSLTSHVSTATLWGITGRVPDHPVATLDWGKVEGTFTYKDGHTRTLHNGFGGMSIRQWRAYPVTAPPGFGTAELQTDSRLTTL